jgi:CheY-like chemotaxis protein
MSGDALVVLINDILDLAKVEAGKMNFEHRPFKLASSISAILHLFENKIQEKNLELVEYYDEEIPEVLLGDPTRLHQIMTNLISNAVKFTEKGSIEVRVNLLEQDKSKVVVAFSVRDTGIGISETEKERIFENFQQATIETTRIYGGTGLGLAIVKQLVEAQGGQIEVNSIPGKGSTFCFVLSFPKTNKKVREAIEMPIAISEMEKTKVLVAEDMKLNQLLMKTLIEEFGFDCIVVDNGRNAVEKLAKESFDIVLMDLQMPEMDGFEATEYIRNELNSDIPIIALTADVTTTDLEKCKMVGMDDYIAKPVDDRLLFNRIVNLLKKHESVPKEVTEIKIENNLKNVDMSHLNKLTKSNENFLSQMILAYLEQTPFLINTIKSSFENKEWDTLCAAVHKLIPSFSLIGMKPSYETMAKKIHDFGHQQQLGQEIERIILDLEKACDETCKELETELSTMNSENHEK